MIEFLFFMALIPLVLGLWVGIGFACFLAYEAYQEWQADKAFKRLMEGD